MEPLIVLSMIAFLASGDTTRKDIPAPSIEACWARAAQFVTQDPHDFEGVVGLGAMCSVRMAKPT